MTHEHTLSTRGDLEKALNEELSAGGLRLLMGDQDGPALFAVILVRVRLPEAVVIEVQGRVVNKAHGACYVLIEDAEAHARVCAQVQAALAQIASTTERSEVTGVGASGSLSEHAPEAKGKAPLARGASRPPWDMIDTGSDVPIPKQLAALSVSERIRLARHAGRPVRRFLIRDVEKQVHLAVVKNPKVKSDEALSYASCPGLSPVALQWMATQRTLTANKAMLMALVLNPGTPTTTVRSLLDRLAHRELLKVMRHPRTRESVTRECRRRLMKAGVL